jgi:hypothetical protein
MQHFSFQSLNPNNSNYYQSTHSTASTTTMQPLEIPQDLKTSTSQQTAIDISFDSVHEQVVRLAEQVKHALASLQSVGLNKIPAEPTEDELLQLPLDNIILDEHLLLLPKRGSINHGPAVAVAELLYPIHSDSLASVIRYEQDRTIICRWIRWQRRYNILVKTKQREEHDWRLHIQQQGLWDPEKQSVSLTGPPSVPMPVDIASAESLEPFFTHLRNEGTHESTTLDASLSAQEINEPYYNTSALEFPRGVLYEDRRLDLCKMVVGPTHIGALMESLRMNTFIKHFLLGNNIIGPKGAREIAAFISEFPNRIDTWYLAGNAMHGPAFSELVDAMVKSPAVTNIWLKRNPLGAKGNNQVVNDVFRLITETPNLRTLDLDQTELGDAGVTELFERLLAHEAPNKLENLYLNGNGINVRGATAIGRYLASAHCAITSLYLSNNPIGDEGVSALSIGLAHGPKTLVRLALQSVGLGDFGVGALVDGLIHHPKLKTLDIGTSYATEDLGQAYNFLTNDSTEYILSASLNPAPSSSI